MQWKLRHSISGRNTSPTDTAGARDAPSTGFSRRKRMATRFAPGSSARRTESGTRRPIPHGTAYRHSAVDPSGETVTISKLGPETGEIKPLQRIHARQRVRKICRSSGTFGWRFRASRQSYCERMSPHFSRTWAIAPVPLVSSKRAVARSLTSNPEKRRLIRPAVSPRPSAHTVARCKVRGPGTIIEMKRFSRSVRLGALCGKSGVARTGSTRPYRPSAKAIASPRVRAANPSLMPQRRARKGDGAVMKSSEPGGTGTSR